MWFDPGGLGHPLPGEIQEVHQAAQVIVVQAVINGKVRQIFCNCCYSLWLISNTITYSHPPPVVPRLAKFLNDLY